MKKYRIVTNGLNYRVQWLGKTFFLRRRKWYWVRQCSYDSVWIAEFDNQTAALDAIIEMRKHEKAKMQGYTPV